MNISRRGLIAVVMTLLVTGPAHGANQPNDGRGEGNPGRVCKPGEDKSGSSGKDSARDSPDKIGVRGIRNGN